MTEITFLARTHPFSQNPARMEVKSGQTIRQILVAIADGARIVETLRIEVGGLEVPERLWDHVKPKPGTQISATVMPAGGDGSKWLRAVLMVVVLIVAWYAAPYAVAAWGAAAGGVTAGAITMLGSLARSALVPYEAPEL